MSLQPVRGTHDLLPDEALKHRYISDVARQCAEKFGFQEIATPIFEFLDVFQRTLGEASDIVHKEMYTFEDRGGEKLVLRPEGTAGLARAFISNGLSHNLPFKAFYYGPMFRYERPQKGRQRQFHQIGVELLGVTSPLGDFECIQLAHWILVRLGLANDVTLHINSIGDLPSRQAYQRALVAYLEGYRSQLSPESQKRLETNPLRVLDSKSLEDQEILKNAPQMADYLNEDSQNFFQITQDLLKTNQIPFSVSPNLVRGLDYYSHVVFEFRTSKLGAQDAVLSGGRYDQLIKTMGGPDTPGVGWAAGMERLALLLSQPIPQSRPVTLIPMGSAAEGLSLKVAQMLRENDFTALMTYSGNPSKRMKKASQAGSACAILIGDDEVTRNLVTVKDLDQGSQSQVKVADLVSYLKGLLTFR